METDSPRRTGNSGWTRVIPAAFLAALVMKLFFFDFMIAEGRSMLPGIKPGDILLVIKTSYGIRLPWSHSYLFHWSMPKEGDIVVFYTPLEEVAVKRCADITENREFIALGDNSLESLDSRSYGPVPVDRIMGKVFGVK
jgi:signal peptidase I